MIKIALMALGICLGAGIATAELQGFAVVPSNPEFRFATGRNGTPAEISPIEHPFLLGIFPVTNEEWAKYAATDTNNIPVPASWRKRKIPQGKEKHPVTSVSLKDAEEYCRWLGRQNTNFVFRLPSEAEWEWAAAGPERKRYPWGNATGTIYRKKSKTLISRMTCNSSTALAAMLDTAKTNAVCVYYGSSHVGERWLIKDLLSIDEKGNVKGWEDKAERTGFVHTDLYRLLLRNGGATSPVDAHPKNKSDFGCREMSGNVREWTTSKATIKRGPERSETFSVVRGGSWSDSAPHCRTSWRDEFAPSSERSALIGFRVAAEPVERKENE